MLSNEELQTISDLFNLTLMIIDKPQNGFNGYLLRCKAPAVERGSDTLVVKVPDEPWQPMRLSDDLEERIALRKCWYRKTGQSLYACVNAEADLEICDKVDRIFSTLSDDEMVQLAQYIFETGILPTLPSFEPFAVVWHLDQYKERSDGTMGRRPIHAHLLIKRRTKRITPEEAAFLRGA